MLGNDLPKTYIKLLVRFLKENNLFGYLVRIKNTKSNEDGTIRLADKIHYLIKNFMENDFSESYYGLIKIFDENLHWHYTKQSYSFWYHLQLEFLIILEEEFNKQYNETKNDDYGSFLACLFSYMRELKIYDEASFLEFCNSNEYIKILENNKK